MLHHSAVDFVLLDVGVSLARLSNPNLIQIFLGSCYIELTNISA